MSKRKIGLGIVVLFLTAGLSFGVCCALLNNKTEDSPENTVVRDPIPEPEPEPVAVSAKTKVLFAGTTFWGRRTNKKARVSELGVTYPFSQLDTFHREDYNAWIAGLECPVTDNGHNDYLEEEAFIFNCDPDYLPEAKKYFTAFMLGNNHTDNQGEDGFAETKEYLKKNDIQYFGSYDYSDGENNCGVVVIPIDVAMDNGKTEEHKMPFGMCSAHGFLGIPVVAARENMEKYANSLPTVSMPHMGVEYEKSADQLRTNLFREMIDRGVEAVLADHPHTIQNTEAYNGHLIVYSMGNFMFDQATFETARSAAIEADIDINVSGVDFKKWDEISSQCIAKDGDCLDLIAGSMQKIDTTWKFDFVGTTTDPQTLIPRAATEEESASIGQRLNWGNIPEELKIR